MVISQNTCVPQNRPIRRIELLQDKQQTLAYVGQLFARLDRNSSETWFLSSKDKSTEAHYNQPR